MVTTVWTDTRGETREATIRRLAERAREAGVRLVRDQQDGRHYASSASRPGEWYLVTGFSCSCRGFMAHGKCMHHSVLIVGLGWIGDDPDPTPPAAPVALAVPAPCPDCGGSGHRRQHVGDRLDDWIAVDCYCRRQVA